MRLDCPPPAPRIVRPDDAVARPPAGAGRRAHRVVRIEPLGDLGAVRYGGGEQEQAGAAAVALYGGDEQF